MVNNCKISLENNDATYLAGSEIKGTLECYFENDITIRGIKIMLSCKERNYFRRKRGPRSNKITIFKEEKLLFGSESDTGVVESGTHAYPFSFSLRHDIPSTFTGQLNGGIFYKIKAVVDIPLSLDYKDEISITVFSPIDFNTLPRDLQKSKTYSNEKTAGFCCNQGELAMSVELPKLTFLVGEIVNFKVIVSNMSYLSVNYLRVKLTKTVTSTLGSVLSPVRKELVEEIVSYTEHGVGAHNLHTFSLELAIPANIKIRNFCGCAMFKETFKLEVSCVFDAAFTRNLSVFVDDIVLGHVPFN